MQNSEVEDQDKQYQRKSSAMEDSTAMTIEFLRARLLSERSVSQTARQRADQLGKRVVELEEQLKIATEQRKKAEKATAEVLAILENSGVSDFSEVVDSGSDQEESLVCKPEENASTRSESVGDDEDVSETSRSKGSKGEDGLLGSEVGGGDDAALQASTLLGRNLSWRNSGSSPNSRGNSAKKSPVQLLAGHKLHSFSCVGGSVQKQHLGKSCRQTRRTDTRSAHEDETDSPTVLQGAGIMSGDISSCFGNKPKQGREVSASEDLLKVAVSENTSGDKGAMKMFPEAVVSCPLTEKRTGSAVDNGGSYRDVDMERVLEQQAQLIGRYEAEEKAQREWEEKFRDASFSTPVSCEAGNQPDATEERNEPNVVFSPDKGSKSKEEQVGSRDKTVGKNLPVGPTPDLAGREDDSLRKKTEHLVGPWPNEISGNESENRNSGPPVQGNTGITRNKGKQQELAEDNLNFNFGPSRVGPINIQEFHQQSSRLERVLESLQFAKLSLKHEMGKLPSSSSERAILAVGNTRGLTDKTSNFMEFPISCDRLFRLPSESQRGVSPQVNFTNLGENLKRHLPDAGTGVATIDRYPGHANKGTGHCSGDRCRSSYMNTAMGTASDPYLKPYMDSGTGNRNFYAYSDLGSRVTSSNQFPNLYLDGRSGLPGEDPYSVYQDRSRWNMRS